MFYKYHEDDLDDMLNAVDDLSVVIYLFQQTDELDAFLKFVLHMSKKADAEVSLLVSIVSTIVSSNSKSRSISDLIFTSYSCTTPTKTNYQTSTRS